MARILAQIAGQIATLLGYDGADFQNLKTDTSGHLQVDALSNALPTGAATEATLDNVYDELAAHTLPTGAATEATLADIKTAAQLIDDLRNALHSVNSDELKVRGEDQLISYNVALISTTTGAVSGAGGYLDSPSPAAGLIWKVTNIRGSDATSATTSHALGVNRGATRAAVAQYTLALAAGVATYYSGEVYLDAGDIVRIYFIGSKAGDSCTIDLTGHIMTKHA